MSQSNPSMMLDLYSPAAADKRDPYAPCTHPSRTCVRKDASDGSIRYYMQCDECGGLGGAIRRDDPRVQTAVPVRDIAEAQWEARRAQWAREKEAARDAWRAKYESHLRSEEWAWRRRKVIEREGSLCQGCRSTRGTDVHHTTYVRLGKELLTDLILLCHKCHIEIAHGRADSDE